MPDIVQFTKRCPACQTEKPVTDFPRNRSEPTGRGGYCRPCQRDALKRSRQRTRERYEAAVALLSAEDRERLGFA
ncbi:hypothetical protein [Microbacterium sp. AK031]|uniref:hypothetical protein n=1 Tax=Microbacterium sp. AK031 TaxID=2723076 RepID=UPI002167527A|nr:hypothetical protein [Microbacterium sp. AK031]MCS3844807.1 hypothetical protein [Microbacterium sp. AK031]